MILHTCEYVNLSELFRSVCVTNLSTLSEVFRYVCVCNMYTLLHVMKSEFLSKVFWGLNSDSSVSRALGWPGMKA
jgi:hypothetical protein